MAKPTKNASLICAVVIIVAFIGIVTGDALWAIFLLLSTVVYKIYRTEGVSTEWASWGNVSNINY
jgi:hypothetical protein